MNHNPINLSIELIPDTRFDPETKMYWGYFKNFPQATATGETELEFIENLKNVFITMLVNETEFFQNLKDGINLHYNDKPYQAA